MIGQEVGIYHIWTNHRSFHRSLATGVAAGDSSRDFILHGLFELLGPGAVKEGEEGSALLWKLQRCQVECDGGVVGDSEAHPQREAR